MLTCSSFDFIFILQYTLCIISLAPLNLIYHKMCEVNYLVLHLLHMLKTCIWLLKSAKIFLASRIVLRVRQLYLSNVLTERFSIPYIKKITKEETSF